MTLTPVQDLVPSCEYIVTYKMPMVHMITREARMGFLRHDRGALIFTARGPGGRCDLDYGGDQALEAGWVLSCEQVVRNEEARYVGRRAREQARPVEQAATQGSAL